MAGPQPMKMFKRRAAPTPVVSDEPEYLHVIKEPWEIDILIEYLKDYEYVAYDTETTGLALDAEVVGFSVACGINRGWYIITKEWDKEKKELIRHPHMDKYLEVLSILRTKKLVMHNALVDVNWTRVNYNTDLLGPLHTDTLVLAHLIDENQSIGLKEQGRLLFGESAATEQKLMMESVIANGGIWEKKRGGNKEMYKADSQLMGRYGAKDTILTLKLFVHYVPMLFEQGLDKFFYEEECMPLLKGPTYDLNTTGLKIDMDKLKKIQSDLTIECDKLRVEVMEAITPYIAEKFPGTKINNTFNLGSGQQLSWLLFIKLGNEWKKLTKGGREWAKEHMGKAPYNPGAKRAFMELCYDLGVKPEKYIQADKSALMNYATKYKWVEKLLKLKASTTLLNTYAIGMERFVKYGVIYPTFFQCGTTGGRYSSSKPNFQNLPRKDKRIKSVVIARPGKSFVGADQEQLEPRVFASQSKDVRLMKCFSDGDDFYSVIGMPVFKRFDCNMKKSDTDKEFFGNKYPTLRDLSKGTALSATYGTTAYKMSDLLRDEEGRNLPPQRTQQIIDDYFNAFPSVKLFQLESHQMAMKDGCVYTLYGRPRRIPEAKKIPKMFPGAEHHELPYYWRSLLNLSVNHRVQGSAASIMNRAGIAFCRTRDANAVSDPRWLEVKIVSQIHDEYIAETPDELIPEVIALLQHCMETTTILPGVALVAKPKAAKSMDKLK